MDFTWLANYAPLSIAANLAGVVGFGLAFFFYFRAKERFVLSYKVVEKLLIQPSSRRPFDLDLPLSRNDQVVSQLTRTYILITNTGNKLIERGDIVGISSIQVSDKAEIIESELVFSDDPGSRASISGGSLGPTRAFDFEFLRPKDGVIFKVDHTGALNELFIECKSKAGGPIRKTNQKFAAIFWPTIVVAMMVLVGYVIWQVANPLPEPFNYQSKHGDDPFIAIFSSFMLGFTAVAGLALAILFVAIVFEFGRRLRGKPALRRARMVFNAIGNNSKNALSL